MSPFYDYPFITAFSMGKVLAPAIALIVVAAGLFWLSNRSRLLALACLWLVVPMLALVNLRMFSDGAIFRIHWMYLPSVGFSLLCAAGLRALRYPTARALALAVVAIFLGYEAKSQSHYWATDWEVARRGIEVAPENHLVEFAMASELQRIGLAAEAIPHLKKALSHGQNYRSLVLLGECYEKLQMYSEAERYERAAIAADPHDPAPRLELGLIEERQQHLAQAETWIREALRLQVPERPELHEALADLFRKEGNTNEALLELGKAASLDPQNAAIQAEISKIRQTATDK
jgi:tetratricopeptide (TPR) repeat protein